VPMNTFRQLTWSGGEVVFRAAAVGSTVLPLFNSHALPAGRDTAHFSLTVKSP